MFDLEKSLTAEAFALLKRNGDIFSCLEPEFERRLSAFLPRFEEIRIVVNKELQIKPDDFQYLPFKQPSFEWHFRRQSLKIVQEILKLRKSLDILEIGSFNSWLTHHLVSAGHNVLAADYFIDIRDGLGSKKYYDTTWTSLQMDLADLSIFNPNSFDIIIVNHGLQFVPEPIDYIRWLKPLLKKGGRIILIGLSLYKDTEEKILEVSKNKQHFKNTFQFDAAIHPSRNYLDFNDKMMLEREGYVLKKYQGMWLRNWAAKLLTTKPAYWYGVFMG
jgi:SAM-dependent methyltransferase